MHVSLSNSTAHSGWLCLPFDQGLLSGGVHGTICFRGDALVGEAGLVVFCVLDHGVSLRIKPKDVKTKEERVYSKIVLPSWATFSMLGSRFLAILTTLKKLQFSSWCLSWKIKIILSCSDLEAFPLRLKHLRILLQFCYYLGHCKWKIK